MFTELTMDWVVLGPILVKNFEPFLWALFVAQLAKWSLPTQEVHGSNPVFGKNIIQNMYF